MLGINSDTFAINIHLLVKQTFQFWIFFHRSFGYVPPFSILPYSVTVRFSEVVKDESQRLGYLSVNLIYVSTFTN